MVVLTFGLMQGGRLRARAGRGAEEQEEEEVCKAERSASVVQDQGQGHTVEPGEQLPPSTPRVLD